MKTVTKINPVIWKSSFFDSIENVTCLFYIFLLSNERANRIFEYHLPASFIAEMLHFTPDKVTECMNELIRVGAVTYNFETGMIQVLNARKYVLD